MRKCLDGGAALREGSDLLVALGQEELQWVCRLGEGSIHPWDEVEATGEEE